MMWVDRGQDQSIPEEGVSTLLDHLGRETESDGENTRLVDAFKSHLEL